MVSTRGDSELPREEVVCSARVRPDSAGVLVMSLQGLIAGESDDYDGDIKIAAYVHNLRKSLTVHGDNLILT